MSSAQIMLLCDPRECYDRCLPNSIYPDGRSILHFRPVVMQV